MFPQQTTTATRQRSVNTSIFGSNTQSRIKTPEKERNFRQEREREREQNRLERRNSFTPKWFTLFWIGATKQSGVVFFASLGFFSASKGRQRKRGRFRWVVFFALSVYGADQMRNRKALSYKANGRKRKTGSLYFVIAIYDGLLLETCPQAISTHLYISMGFRLDVCLILWRVHFQNWAATRALHFRYRFEEGQQHNWML